MATAETVRDVTAAVLRISVEELPEHLAILEAELAGGRSIELTRGNEVVAEVRPRAGVVDAPEPPPMPDFMGRMKDIFGDKVFPAGYMTQAVRRDRDGDD